MSANRRPTIAIRLLFGMALAGVSAGCGGGTTSGPSGAGEVNIGLNNQSGRRLNVVITLNGVAQPGISVNQGAYVTDEFSGASDGIAITFNASANDGAPALTLPTKVCHAKSSIIGTSEYGQVDFTPNSILCQDDHTWQ